jgi:DNA-binding NarL/FixJ family response regulator
MDGIAATEQLAAAAPDVKVLVLTTFDQDDYLFEALRAGASGFLLKRARPEELIAAVHTVAGGESLLSPAVTRRVIDRIVHQPRARPRRQHDVAALTRRELEVLDAMARGLSNRPESRQSNDAWLPVYCEPGVCRYSRRYMLSFEKL